eukprot:PLAT9055.2.p1 GENE.PLAT9055.2~~PLAT9055.2.p1  ORF type:complete len:1244 (+),score=663.11 PLAT9055.2:524-3733(+)
MAARDERGDVMTEMLSSVRLFKLLAWERWAEARVTAIRDRELQALWSKQLLTAGNNLLSRLAPLIVTVATFATYTAAHGRFLPPSTTFAAMAWFNILQAPLSRTAGTVSALVTAKVSLDRLTDFLCAPELPASGSGSSSSSRRRSRPRFPTDPERPVLLLRAASFAWRPAEPPVLADVSLSLPAGGLLLVVGSVGSGKSSLLAAACGSLLQLSGDRQLHGSLAVVGQPPWVQNGSLRDNVLFGSRLRKKRLAAALHASCFTPDLRALPHGVHTLVGDRGVALSGGQQQRLALARAIYRDADVYLLDDVLSAVDGDVANQLWRRAVCGCLAGKTRVIATHQLRFVNDAEVTQVLWLDNGRVRAYGTPADVLAAGLMSDVGGEKARAESDSEAAPAAAAAGAGEAAAGDVGAAEGKSEDGDGDVDVVEDVERLLGEGDTAASSLKIDILRTREGRAGARGSPGSHSSPLSSPGSDTDSPHDARPAVEAENKSAGEEVALADLMGYLEGYGIAILLPMAAFYLLWQAGTLGGNFVLSAWSDSPSSAHVAYYLRLYALVGAGAALFALLQVLLLALGSLRSSRLLHLRMLAATLASPLSMFDTQPAGRVLNRFVDDQASVDEQLPSRLNSFVVTALRLLAVFVAVIYVTPLTLAVIVPLSWPYYKLAGFYRPAARDLRRIESASRSPIISHYSEMLRGAAVIRAFGDSARFHSELAVLLRCNADAFITYWAANQWVTWVLEALGCLVILATVLLAFVRHNATSGSGGLNAGLFGLSLTYVLQLPAQLMWLVRCYSVAETSLISVERVLEYTRLPSEPQARPPVAAAHWKPRRGELEFINVSMRYRPELPLVLRGVELRVAAGSKMALLGRTGSGKSSLFMALLRCYPIESGVIRIDGMDTVHVRLQQLRAAVSSVPQAPILFKGTLRTNILAREEQHAVVPHDILQRVGLLPTLARLPDGIDSVVDERGDNLSMGERQLVCCARALIRGSAIVLADEATSSVDAATAAIMNRALLRLPATVLSIVHRLAGLRAYSGAIVMKDGVVAETGSIAELMARDDSMLSAMLREEEDGE